MDQFNSEAAGIQKALGSQSSDPLVQSYVQQALGDHISALAPSVAHDAFGLEAGTWRAGMDRHSVNSGLMATAPNDLARATVQHQFENEVTSGQAAHYLTPEQATQTLQQFKSRTAETQVRKDMLADPAGTASTLLDPAAAQQRYPGLLPETSEVLAMRADNRALRIETRAASAQAHVDAMATKQLHQTQDANESAILGHIYTDPAHPPDDATIADWAQHGLIRPEALVTIHTAMNQGKEGTNDPQAVLNLYQRLGDHTLTANDVHTAVAARALKGSTAYELMSAINEQGKQAGTVSAR